MNDNYVYFYIDNDNEAERHVGLTGSGHVSAIADRAPGNIYPGKLYRTKIEYHPPKFERRLSETMHEINTQLNKQMGILREAIAKGLELDFEYSGRPSKTLIQFRCNEISLIPFFLKINSQKDNTEWKETRLRTKIASFDPKQYEAYLEKPEGAPHPDTFEDIRGIYSRGDCLTLTIDNINRSKGRVFVSVNSFIAVIDERNLLDDISAYRPGQKIKAYLSNFNDSKKQIYFSQTSCGLSSPLRMAGSDVNLGLKANDMDDVIPLVIAKSRNGASVVANYRGYVSYINFPKHYTINKVANAVTLGKPMRCVFHYIDKEGRIQWLFKSKKENQGVQREFPLRPGSVAKGVPLSELPLAFECTSFFRNGMPIVPEDVCADLKTLRRKIPVRGERAEARILLRHIAGLVLDCGEWGVCFLPAIRVDRTIDGYNRLQPGDKLEVRVEFVSDKGYVKLASMVESSYPFAEGQTMAVGELVLVWHYPDYTLAADNRGLLLRIMTKHLGGKFSHKFYETYVADMVRPAAGTRLNAEILCENNKAYNENYVCRVTDGNFSVSDNLYKQSVKGRVIRVETDNECYIVDFGNRLGIVPMEQMAWRIDDSLRDRIAAGDEFEFRSIGFVKGKKSFIKLSRLIMDIGNIQLDRYSDYKGYTQGTTADGYFSVGLENGYTLYVPLEEAAKKQELLSPFGDSSVMSGKKVKVKYLRFDFVKGRLYGCISE